MSQRLTSSCSGAVSSIRQHGIAHARFTTPVHRPASFTFVTVRSLSSSNALLDRKQQVAVANEKHYRPEQAALLAIQNASSVALDRLNAPLSTLPPPLDLPDPASGNKLMYFLRLGKVYGGFYWVGLKAVWFNNKAARALRQRIQADEAREGSELGKPTSTTTTLSQQVPVHLRQLSRAEFQLLARNAYDIGKLPFFGLLVCLLGEWLPLIVPFVPGIVPGTCRIPKQVSGMLAKAEQRRRTSFRQGVRESPSITASPHPSSDSPSWSLTHPPPSSHTISLLSPLSLPHLHHLSSTLNLHAKVWDWLRIPPPASLLRRAISKRLNYLVSDDLLLLRDGAGPSQAPSAAVRLLSPAELHIACSQRGIDVLGRRDDLLREQLAEWLKRQRDDKGRGSAVLLMLFRRPNAWATKVSPRD